MNMREENPELFKESEMPYFSFVLCVNYRSAHPHIIYKPRNIQCRWMGN